MTATRKAKKPSEQLRTSVDEARKLWATVGGPTPAVQCQLLYVIAAALVELVEHAEGGSA